MKPLFLKRRYLHFDEPLTPREAESLATDPARIAQWGFLPMLQRIIRARKVTRKDNVLKKKPPKDRPIAYAGHKDAAIYSYYGHLLGECYETAVKTLGIGECVTAFRTGSGRCNIDFAMEAFDWIRRKGECVAHAFDVRGFFDNLDHVFLKEQWAKVLGVQRLPPDHFAVFQSLTRFAFVDQAAVYKEFGISEHKPRANDRMRICSPAEFRDRVRGKGLIQKNTSNRGIPQGSPMSAVLSNIYMTDFDVSVSERVQAVGGLYRRYCDDILCVVPVEESAVIQYFVSKKIERAKLEIQHEKTKSPRFADSSTRLTATEPLQYLGFTFDGQRVLLRTASVARYYRKMRQGALMAALGKRKQDAIRDARGEPPEPLRRRKLNIRYSYIGRHNFISYAFRAAKKMGEAAIRKQVKRHWKKLNLEANNAVRKISKEH